MAEQDREALLAWTHETYIPRVLARPGVLWGAHYASENDFTPLGGGGRISHKKKPEADVPTGDRYILMFGAAEPHAFVNPSPRDFHAAFDERDRAMLAKRVAERTNIMLQEARIDGPEKTAGVLPGPAIGVVRRSAARAVGFLLT